MVGKNASPQSERILGTQATQGEELRGSKVTRKSLSDEGSQERKDRHCIKQFGLPVTYTI